MKRRKELVYVEEVATIMFVPSCLYERSCCLALAFLLRLQGLEC